MSRSQKVGVLTFHRCINYGSYWQARCAVEGLRQLGTDAVLLDHRSSKVNRAEWKCALQPTLPRRTPRIDHSVYAAKARKFFEAFEALPLSAPFALENPAGMEAVDLVVVGSDEVWNLRHPWYAGYPLFFGEGLNAGRLVSYAASFGSHDAADGLEEPWADRLRRFTAIGVRDQNSQRMIQTALGFDPPLVLDPCLQFDAVCRRPPTAAGSGDVLVYGHSFPAWFVAAIRTWAAGRGARLVSLGYRNDWADEQWIAAGPEDFAQAMADAAGVVTNFFHGCVFALVNAKPFVCVRSDYRSNKINALAAAVGAEGRLVAEGAPQSFYDAALDEPLDEAIGSRIEALRRRSGAYLDHALN
jgi:hypothetical protein